MWTINQGDGSISRVDIKTNKVVATIEAGIPGGGGEIAVGEGSVWVTSFEYPITRIDVATNKVVQQFYGDGGDAIRFGHRLGVAVEPARRERVAARSEADCRDAA